MSCAKRTGATPHVSSEFRLMHNGKALHVQPRDVAMLDAIYRHPHLATSHIVAYVQAECPTITSAQGKTTWRAGAEALQRRLKNLETHGLINVAREARALNKHGNFDLQYFITTRGVRLLEAYSNQALYWKHPNYTDTALGTLQHARMLNHTWLSLHLALQDVGTTITRWHQDARIFSPVTVPSYEEASRHTMQLQPDSFCIINRPNGTGQAIFWEVDRSGGVRLNSKSRPYKSMLSRYRRYWHYQRGNNKPFIQLTLVKNKGRMKNIQALIRDHAPWNSKRTGLFWFKHFDEIVTDHSAILTGWETAWEEQRDLLND